MTYIQTVSAIKQENRTLIYTDKTWVDEQLTQEYIRVDSDGGGGGGGVEGAKSGKG